MATGLGRLPLHTWEVGIRADTMRSMLYSREVGFPAYTCFLPAIATSLWETGITEL